jgi:branched-chain amino acid transport system substrate-binding protein
LPLPTVAATEDRRRSLRARPGDRTRRSTGAGERSRSWSAIALAGLLTVTAAGCSSTGGRPTAAASCAGSPSASDPIHLGLLESNSGAIGSTFRDYRGGIDARLGLLNAQGGIDGRKVVYDWADDQSQTAANLVGAQTLLAQQPLVAMIEGSATSIGSAAFLQERNIPVVGTAIEPDWYSNDNMFSASRYYPVGAAPQAWGKFAAARGGTRAALITLNLSETARQVTVLMRQSLEAAGIPIVFTQDAGSTDSDAQLAAKIRQSGANVLMAALPIDLYAPIIASVNASGPPMRAVIASSGYDPQVLAQYGRSLAGTYLYLTITPFERNLPVQREFSAAMETYAPQVQQPRTQFAVDGWTAADIVVQALKAARSCPTAASVLAALRTMHSYNGNGMIEPIDLADRTNIQSCYNFVQVNAAGTGFTVAQPAPYC